MLVGVHVSGDSFRNVNKATVLTSSRCKQIRSWMREAKCLTGFTLARIKTLDFSPLYFLYDDGVRTLVRYRLTNLTTLNLAKQKIGNEACKVFKKIPSLTNLNLSSNFIGTDGVRHLAPLPNLVSLNLSFNKIGGHGLWLLSKKHTDLRTLNLRGNPIGSGAEYLDDQAKCKLTNLNLRNCKITNHGAKQLAKNLTIKDLTLTSNSKITRDGVKAFLNPKNKAPLRRLVLWNELCLYRSSGQKKKVPGLIPLTDHRNPYVNVYGDTFWVPYKKIWSIKL